MSFALERDVTHVVTQKAGVSYRPTINGVSVDFSILYFKKNLFILRNTVNFEITQRLLISCRFQRNIIV